MDENVESAIRLLRERGYRVSPIGDCKNELYLIKQPIHDFRVTYHVRKHRTTLADRNSWKEGTMIALIDQSKLKWEPIIPGKSNNGESNEQTIEQNGTETSS